MIDHELHDRHGAAGKHGGRISRNGIATVVLEDATTGVHGMTVGFVFLEWNLLFSCHI